MNYLYFAEATVETTGEAAMYPASSFTGLDPTDSTTTQLSFKSRNGAATDDEISIKHASGKHFLVAEAIANVLEPSSVTTSKFIVVADAANGVYLNVGNGAGITGTVAVTSPN